MLRRSKARRTKADLLEHAPNLMQFRRGRVMCIFTSAMPLCKYGRKLCNYNFFDDSWLGLLPFHLAFLLNAELR